MRELIAATAAAAAALFALGVLPAERSAAQAATFVLADESRVQSLVNATRRGKSVGALVRDEQLVQMARGQSSRQADKGNIFHNVDLGGESTRRGLDWLKVGENVGMGPSVDLVEDAFLKSPHHYANIIDPAFDAIGVGVVNGADGRRYVTQVFADLAPATPRLAPRPAPAKPVPPARTPRPAVSPGVTQVAPSTPSPVARPAPVKASREPNIVVGGVVQPLDLAIPRFDQAKRIEEPIGTSSPGAWARFIDFVTF